MPPNAQPMPCPQGGSENGKSRPGLLRIAIVSLVLLAGGLTVPGKGGEPQNSLAPQQVSVTDSNSKEDLPSGPEDGGLQITPALSAPSASNGGMLTLQALVKTRAGVDRVKAGIKGLGRLELKPASCVIGGAGWLTGMASLVTTGTIGCYQAKLKVNGLAAKTYPVTLQVTDLAGRAVKDQSLAFTAPPPGTRLLDAASLPSRRLAQRRGGSVTNAGAGYLCSAVIDPRGEYACFGTATAPGMVVKVRLSDFTRVGTLTLKPGEDFLYSAVIDPSGAYAYFGTSTTAPGKVVKVRLSDLTRIGALRLNDGENDLRCAVIDPLGRYAYFGTSAAEPGVVIKVRLADFTRTGALRLGPGENDLRCAAMDPAGEHAYFGTLTAPGRVVKVRLADLKRVGALKLKPGEDYLHCAAMDPAGKYAYWGTVTAPGIVVKVRLSDFTRMEALRLNRGENDLRCAIVDSSGTCAYFGSLTAPGRVARVRLADFTSLGTLTLDEGENFLDSAVIDPAGRYAFFGTSSAPGQAFRVAVHQNAVHASRITVCGNGPIKGVLFYSHSLTGNLRLALYEDSSPGRLLWHSCAAAGVTAGSWLAMPVSAGTPDTLSLEPGTYRLAWQDGGTNPRNRSAETSPVVIPFPASLERDVTPLHDERGAESR